MTLTAIGVGRYTSSMLRSFMALVFILIATSMSTGFAYADSDISKKWDCAEVRSGEPYNPHYETFCRLDKGAQAEVRQYFSGAVKSYADGEFKVCLQHLKSLQQIVKQFEYSEQMVDFCTMGLRESRVALRPGKR